MSKTVVLSSLSKTPVTLASLEFAGHVAPFEIWGGNGWHEEWRVFVHAMHHQDGLEIFDEPILVAEEEDLAAALAKLRELGPDEDTVGI